MKSNINSDRQASFTLRPGPSGARGRVTVCLLGIALALTLSSCDEDEPAPIPTGSTPTTATPTRPAWEAKYTADEIAAYEEALATWDRYQQEAEPIWKAGKVTPEAEKLFKRYFATNEQLINLDFYEKNHLTRTGRAKVLSTEPTRIKVSTTGGSVSIRQCLDASTITVTQNGETVEPENVGPQVFTFEMGKAEGRWIVFRLKESVGDSPCDA
ncbi:hypothetical protein GCM10022234_21720 [Aeromicrobium panaciterrae]|uniref:hypothetical protein n=1 Tax=Aeromicrobium panaciterrae TaxID=363861 RepID=UPI0031DF0FF5